MSNLLDSFFNSAAKKHNVNPRVLKSIAQIESNFRDDIIKGRLFVSRIGRPPLKK